MALPKEKHFRAGWARGYARVPAAREDREFIQDHVASAEYHTYVFVFSFFPWLFILSEQPVN